MTEDEVRRKVAEVLALVREERELRDQLVVLDRRGEAADPAHAARRAEVLQAIDHLRWDRLLPIVRDVGELVVSEQGATGVGSELAHALNVAVRGVAPSSSVAPRTSSRAPERSLSTGSMLPGAAAWPTARRAALRTDAPDLATLGAADPEHASVTWTISAPLLGRPTVPAQAPGPATPAAAASRAAPSGEPTPPGQPLRRRLRGRGEVWGKRATR